jgi:hypothetical protein
VVTFPSRRFSSLVYWHIGTGVACIVICLILLFICATVEGDSNSQSGRSLRDQCKALFAVTCFSITTISVWLYIVWLSIAFRPDDDGFWVRNWFMKKIYISWREVISLRYSAVWRTAPYVSGFYIATQKRTVYVADWYNSDWLRQFLQNKISTGSNRWNSSG